ncbi:MAG: hypothetical protein F6K47_02220 [Symploca sp. SIO2E6]|nr:hypothetical protein [Symploca sp. SIO2E6]
MGKIPDFFRFIQLISLFNQEVGDLDYSRLGKIPDFFRFIQLISLFNQEVGDLSYCLRDRLF